MYIEGGTQDSSIFLTWALLTLARQGQLRKPCQPTKTLKFALQWHVAQMCITLADVVFPCQSDVKKFVMYCRTKSQNVPHHFPSPSPHVVNTCRQAPFFLGKITQIASLLVSHLHF